MTKKYQEELVDKLQAYRSTYLLRPPKAIDELTTKMIVDQLLIHVLGYDVIDDLKLLQSVRANKINYLLLDKMLVDIRSMSIDLAPTHQKQIQYYAVKKEIPWILISNARQFQLYRLESIYPAKYKLFFDLDLKKIKHFRSFQLLASFIHKKGLSGGQLEKLWERSRLKDPSVLSKFLYRKEVIRSIQNLIRKDNKVVYDQKELLSAVRKIVHSS